MVGFLIIKPSRCNFWIFRRELAKAISLTSLGSNQILRFPHLRTEAAKRFCNFRETKLDGKRKYRNNWVRTSFRRMRVWATKTINQKAWICLGEGLNNQRRNPCIGAVFLATFPDLHSIPERIRCPEKDTPEHLIFLPYRETPSRATDWFYVSSSWQNRGHGQHTRHLGSTTFSVVIATRVDRARRSKVAKGLAAKQRGASKGKHAHRVLLESKKVTAVSFSCLKFKSKIK